MFCFDCGGLLCHLPSASAWLVNCCVVYFLLPHPSSQPHPYLLNLIFDCCVLMAHIRRLWQRQMKARFTCRSGYGAEATNSAVEPHYLKKFRAAAASKAASKAKSGPRWTRAESHVFHPQEGACFIGGGMMLQPQMQRRRCGGMLW